MVNYPFLLSNALHHKQQTLLHKSGMLFYRKSIVDSLDWGISIAPMSSSNFPSMRPDITFDLKARLLKGNGIIPTLTLGVNMLKIANFDTANPDITPIFLDAGRLGLSWEFITCKEYDEMRGCLSTRRNYIYLGADVVPGSSDIGDKLFAGIKFGSLNFMVKLTGELSSLGIAYCF